MYNHHEKKEFTIAGQVNPEKRIFEKTAEGGGTLGISGWGCTTGTMEPLTYTRASLAEFATLC